MYINSDIDNDSWRNTRSPQHICLIYDTPEEWRDMVIPFLTQGLERNEKCLYITESDTSQRVCAGLSDAGIEALAVQKSGQMVFISAQEIYINDHEFDHYQAILFFINQVRLAQEQGFDSIRVSCEMNGLLDCHMEMKLLLEYEARLNRYFFSKYPCTFLCQYNFKKFDPCVIKEVISNHPLVMQKGHVNPNSYYAPPRVFLSREGGQYAVQGLLNKIEREYKHQCEAQFFIDVLENSAQPFYATYPDGRILKCNSAFRKLVGYDETELSNIKWGIDLTPPECRIFEKQILKELQLTGAPQRYEKEYICRNGTRVAVELLAHQVCDSDGKIQYYYAFVTDISHRKQIENRLLYLGLHDPLTGLYNRNFFEQEILRLEKTGISNIGLIMCDLDGLKLVNDSLGHDRGDSLLIKAADLLRDSIGNNGVIARIGGDEFVVLMTETDAALVAENVRRIEAALQQHRLNGESLLNISIGFTVSNKQNIDLRNLIKKADDNMYREKLLHSQSARSAITQVLRKTLEARDFLTEGHAERLQRLIGIVAPTLGLPEYKINDLRLLAEFHDIGKVGVPDSILFKPGPLSQKERTIMHRHSEIGYRIALSSPDLSTIADWILKHHEWWNGKGYPLGLKGEDIPLECRILGIMDAYDAMTSDRPYRKAMNHEEALLELTKNAGMQFDPILVQNMARSVTKNNSNVPMAAAMSNYVF